MSEEITAEQLDAKQKAQERVTKPLHLEDVPLFLRESIEIKKVDGQDRQEANRE